MRSRIKKQQLTAEDFERAGFLLIESTFLRPDGSQDRAWRWIPPDFLTEDPDTLLPGYAKYEADWEKQHPQRVVVIRTRAEREGSPVYYRSKP